MSVLESLCELEGLVLLEEYQWIHKIQTNQLLVRNLEKKFEKIHNRLLHTTNRAFLDSRLERYWVRGILNHTNTGVIIKIWSTCPSEIYVRWTIVLVLCSIWTKWYRLPAACWNMCWWNTCEVTRFTDLSRISWEASLIHFILSISSF